MVSGRNIGLGLLVLLTAVIARSTQSQPPAPAANAQNRNNPVQDFVTPPAPPLSPADEMKTFQVVPGYRWELVAADPIIKDPVAMTFDPDGRIWVCEMRGFMPDINGTNENAPVGVISVLDDTDGDGLMDKSTIFVDGLVLPRGLCWTTDGLLVCENGTIWLCHDTDGDFKCDNKEVVCTYNPGNLEHSLNGLMPALDNSIYNAKEGIRLRRANGKWIAENNAPRGQWGITQDNYGYLYYNINASLIRGDLVPCYSPNAQASSSVVDVQLYDEQVMFPIRPTPGINRGYIPDFLRPDGSLIEANANCGPVVYRGDNLPSELIGNVFIPEPAGNLIRRQVIVERDGKKTSKNAYDKKEFMASTDERFRPVNMYNSPDGTLYMIDMYRGIIQHGAYITPYLRQQILDRQLDKVINLGRIYRLVHDSTVPRKPTAMTKLSGRELVGYLSHPNGWHRDTAQQLLVQRGDLSVVPAVEQLATKGANPLGRLHAAWTLDGLNRINPEVLFELLSDKDPNVRASAASIYKRLLNFETLVSTVVEDLETIRDDADQNVRMQLVQTLGLVNSAKADSIIEPFLKSAAENSGLLESLLAGFAGREVEFLQSRLTLENWSKNDAWREKLLSASAQLLWKQRTPLSVLRMAHLINSVPGDRNWQQIALLEGIKDPPPTQRRPGFGAAGGRGAPQSGAGTGAGAGAGAARGAQPARGGRGAGGRGPAIVRLPVAPEGLDVLRTSADSRVAAAAKAFADRLQWPGKDGQPLPERPPLSSENQRLYDLGQREYMTLCAGCHHPAGYGHAAKGPALLGSNWLSNQDRLIRLVLLGVSGPININEELFNADGRLSMPGMYKTLDDEKIAGVLTFVRREWSDESLPPIEIASVAKIRKLLESRTEPWTEAELMKE